MNSTRIRFLIVSLLSLPLSVLVAGRSTGDLKPGRNDIEFDHQGRTRTAIIMVPKSAAIPPEGWPLVMMLHGAGGSSKNVLESTGWAEQGEKEGIVTVFPNGTPRDESKPESFSRNPQTWNSGAKLSLSSGNSSAIAKNVDDVGFLTQLLERVRRQLKIDPKRIFVAGHSNGAQMAYRFASERSTMVAAVGVMAGHSYAEQKTLGSPVSLIQIVGDHDPFTPMAGGKAGVLGLTMTVPPALDSPRLWAQSLGISDEARITRNDDTLTIRSWGPVTGGAEVRSIVVKGHGHAYLSRQDRFHPALLFGPTVKSINATETMWEFFKAHPKR
ncbi:MAG: alpha/beta hydrolase-fold protein [Ignavibacteriales bacterium]|nr:alpha/beta hydrolase-fold protein [Ignavibacteriales bacterium]